MAKETAQSLFVKELLAGALSKAGGRIHNVSREINVRSNTVYGWYTSGLKPKRVHVEKLMLFVSEEE